MPKYIAKKLHTSAFLRIVNICKKSRQIADSFMVTIYT
jgi:hypothetical protein